MCDSILYEIGADSKTFPSYNEHVLDSCLWILGLRVRETFFVQAAEKMYHCCIQTLSNIILIPQPAVTTSDLDNFSGILSRLTLSTIKVMVILKIDAAGR